jgi:hypothetical protein
VVHHVAAGEHAGHAVFGVPGSTSR